MSGSHQRSPLAAALPGSASPQSSCRSMWQNLWSHVGACRVPASFNILTCSYIADARLKLTRCHADAGIGSAVVCGKSIRSWAEPFDMMLLLPAGMCECRELAQTQCLCKSGLPHQSYTMRGGVQCAGRLHRRLRQNQTPGLLCPLPPQCHEHRHCKRCMVLPCIVHCCQSCECHVSCYNFC